MTKDITYQFEDTISHALIESNTYDLVKPDGSKGVTDGAFPMSVRPGLLAANMPKTEAGDTRRLTLLIVSGNDTRSDSYYAEPYSAGTRLWAPSGSRFVVSSVVADPKLELTDSPAFRFTLIDSAGEPVIDGAPSASIAARGSTTNPRTAHVRPRPSTASTASSTTST